jgi:hypothetical protein
MAETGTEAQAVATIDDALAHVPPILLAEAESERVTHGSKVSCPDDPETGGMSGLVRIHDPLGRLLALAWLEGGILRPELVFSTGS